MERVCKVECETSSLRRSRENDKWEAKVRRGAKERFERSSEDREDSLVIELTDSE